MTFESSPVTVFDFAYSAANHHSRQDIVDSIKTTAYTGGSTGTRPALQHVGNNIFSIANGMREHSKKKLMVLTDGNYNIGGDPRDVAKSLHERPGANQVDVFALRIGSRLSNQNLQDLIHASGSKKLLPLLSFHSFTQFSDRVQLVALDAQLSTNSCSSSAFKHVTI